MKRYSPYLAAALLGSILSVALFGQVHPSPQSGIFVGEGHAARRHHHRTARRSPAHKFLSTPRYQARAGVPASFGVVPSRLDIWGNNVDGDCVSAEEAAAKAMSSLMAGYPELWIDPQTLVSWARRHGYLNGAALTDVMDTMISEGIQAADGKTYHDGPYRSVDWRDDAALSSAISEGPVKIGVAANQLENAVNQTNDANGWIATGFSRDGNVDHCVNLCGFGTLAECCAMLNVAVPAGLDASARCYLLFTWGSIGAIDRSSLIAICDEAWIRTPTTPELTPKPTPQPQPEPTPQPQPSPTPQPTPNPSDADVEIRASIKHVTLKPGWTARPSPGPPILVHPHIKKVDVPPGWSIGNGAFAPAPDPADCGKGDYWRPADDGRGWESYGHVEGDHFAVHRFRRKAG